MVWTHAYCVAELLKTEQYNNVSFIEKVSLIMSVQIKLICI